MPAQPTTHASVLNVASIHAGSRVEAPADERGPPPMRATANRIPDVAWALVEVRAGGPEIHAAALQAQAQAALDAFNTGRDQPATFERFDLHFELTGYASGEAAIAPIARCFHDLHGGRRSEAAHSGYIDVAMLASERGSGAVCMGPNSGGAHAPDEWVDLESLRTYRDGMVRLLRLHATG